MTIEDIINRLNCSWIRAQKFLDAAENDLDLLIWLIEREEFKQNNTPAVLKVK
ncbi:hypothetical protein [Staphylococcus xylosus]|uniref:hypothetical protein n=1 Tax=Staphylococcus xylosus TaxID=1288 RepID=UPI001304B27F|nr:hypothetical protein [Staphylococcus xylosus]